jgi:hypothetical protein
MALTIQAAEERAFAVVGDSRSRQIGVHVCLSDMVRRHLVPFATI